jgi:hypothetical protein
MRKNGLLIVTAVVFFVFLVFCSSTQAYWILDSRGFLLNTDRVLGQKTQVKENQGKNDNQNQTAAAKNSTFQETKINQSGNSFQPTESTVNGDPPRLMEKIQILPNGTKLQLKFQEKIQNTWQEQVSSGSSELVIEESDSKNKVTIRSHDQALVVITNKIAAQTHFPLMVNPETNELIVTTPAGQKVVTILPDKAVQHMLAANVLDVIGGKGGLRWLEYQKQASGSGTLTPKPTSTESAQLSPTPTESATESAELTPIPTSIASTSAQITSAVTNTINLITTPEGDLAYEIPGLKYKKLFGLYKVTISKTALVSAETGELLRVVEDFRNKLIDLLSV